MKFIKLRTGSLLRELYSRNLSADTWGRWRRCNLDCFKNKIVVFHKKSVFSFAIASGKH